MKNTIIYSLVALMAVVLLQPSAAQAEEIDLSGMEQADMLELIEQLTAQVAELREQLDAQRAEMQEFREEVRAGLSQGMRDEDVRKLQELLASDPDIYPERLTTGYFGPLTSQALSRLQQRHDLPATGELDEDTRDLINQYFAERTGREDAPEGLLRAPGIMQAVERGVCERGRGNRPFCPQVSEEDDEDSEGESASGRPDHAGPPAQAGRPDRGDESDEDEEVRVCGLDEFDDLVGTEITDRDDVIERWEAYHDAEAGSRSVRFLNPGDAMTMDYSETRLNVFFDEDGVVERVTCG